MSNNEFLHILKIKLRPLPRRERDEALMYYEEYLAEGGEGCAESLNVDETARKIINELNVKTEKKTPFKALWLSLLALFAAPTAVPIGLALLFLALVILLIPVIILLSVFLCCVGFIVCGIYLTATGFIIIASNLASALMLTGSGLLLAGLGMLILMACIWLSRKSASLFTSLFRTLKGVI